MDNPGTTKSRTRLLWAYGFSLALHAAVVGCAFWFMGGRKPPVASGEDMIFTIESDAELAGVQAEPAPSEGEPQAPAGVEVAGAPEKNAGEPERYLPLLSELPRFDVPAEDANERTTGKPSESENWLEKASRAAPMVVTSNATAPAVDPMEAYFAVFIQSIRDAYRKPGELERQGQLSVRVNYEVKADGTVGTVNVVRSSGSAAYDQSVVKAFRSIASIGPRPDARSSVNVADFCLAN